MRGKFAVLLFLASVLATFQPAGASQPVNISIEGFPLTLDVFKPKPAETLATYHAEGVARVEGSAIFIDLAPGTSLPTGGLVIDGETRISPELSTALGLPSTAKLFRGIYSGTVYASAPTIPAVESALYARVGRLPNGIDDRGTVYNPTQTLPDSINSGTIYRQRGIFPINTGTVYRPTPTFPESFRTGPTVQLNLGATLDSSGPRGTIGLVLTWGR